MMIALQTSINVAKASHKTRSRNGKSTITTERVRTMIKNLADKNRMISNDYLPSNRLLNEIAKQKNNRALEYICLSRVENVLNDKAQPVDEKEKPFKPNWSHTWSVTEYMRKLTILLNAYLMLSYESDTEHLLSVKTALIYEMKVRTLMNIDDINLGYARKEIQTAEATVRNNWYNKMKTENSSFDEIVMESIDSSTFPDRKEVRNWVTAAKTSSNKPPVHEAPQIAKAREESRQMSWSGWEDPAPTKDKKNDTKRKSGGSSNDWNKQQPASWEKFVPYSDEWKKRNWTESEIQADHKTDEWKKRNWPTPVRTDMTPDGKQPGRERWVDRKDTWCKNHQMGRCRYPASMCNRAHTQQEFDEAVKRFAKKK